MDLKIDHKFVLGVVLALIGLAAAAAMARWPYNLNC